MTLLKFTPFQLTSASWNWFLALLGVYNAMAVNPQVQAFVDAQSGYNSTISADIDDIVAKVAVLNDTIAKLQATPPVLSTEDQGLLDSIQAQGKAIAEKADAADGKTPPAVPPSLMAAS